MLSNLIKVVAGELRRAAAEAPTPAEVARAKAQIKAGMLMGLESSSARAEYMARQLLLFDRLIDTKEIVARIEAVTPEAVRDLAARLVTRSKPSVTIVGAGRRGAAHASMAERLMHEARPSRAA
jgi:predicted Zn-dependent peptidase